VANLNGILKDSRIRGGRAVIRGTNMEVARIIFYLNKGSEADFLESFPHLEQAHIDRARKYYAEHKEEIDAEIYLIEHPEAVLNRLGYTIVPEKSGIKRVVKR